jgi:hypothetical protein
MRNNPFALARAQRILIRAARLKAELRAQHDASTKGFLSDKSTPANHPRSAGTEKDPIRLRYHQPVGDPPEAHKTPERMEHYENYIPIAIRRAALRANHKARGIKKRGKHRPNGLSKGPKIDDSDLARHYYRLIQEYRLGPDEAAQELARALHQAEGIEEKSARVRLRKALGKLD